MYDSVRSILCLVLNSFMVLELRDQRTIVSKESNPKEDVKWYQTPSTSSQYCHDEVHTSRQVVVVVGGPRRTFTLDPGRRLGE